MNYLMSFIVGGIICVIGQILIDKTNLNTAYILVTFVVSGVILTYLGIYDKVIDIGFSGATVPLIGFGNALAKGAVEEAAKNGIIGAISGGIKRTAPGVGAAILFGYLVANIFNPKAK